MNHEPMPAQGSVDATVGRPVRGEMADALVGTACTIQCVGFMQFGGELIDAPPPNTDATPVFILAPNVVGKGRYAALYRVASSDRRERF